MNFSKWLVDHLIKTISAELQLLNFFCLETIIISCPWFLLSWTLGGQWFSVGFSMIWSFERRKILTACSVLNNLMCQKIASVSGNETWSDMTYCKCETTWSQCFGNLTNGQLCNINYNPKFWMISHSYKRWTIVVWSGNNYENKASTIITYKYALKIFVSSHPDNRIS